MKDLLKTLASLKLAVGVLVLLLLALGAGTIVETLKGAEEAGRLVYRSWWMFGLLQLLAASVASSAYLRYPWDKRLWGFAATHLGVALLLVGAAVTFRYGVEGELLIWRGQSANEVIKRDGRGKAVEGARLPFHVQLDDFRIEHYPGSDRPSGYRSSVQIVDPEQGTSGADIWMNHGLSHGEWDFYQSSYRFTEDGRVASILLASSDPGRKWVFLGYGVLLVGMGLVIATRISQQRRSATEPSLGETARRDNLSLGLAALIVLAVAGGVVFSTRQPASSPDTEALRRLPVQNDGRIMPLDTLARESVKSVTGKSTWQGADPVETTLAWLSEPEKTAKASVVKFGSYELAPVFGLSPKTPYISALEFENRREHLRQLFQNGAARGDQLEKLRSATIELEQRLQRLYGFIKGDLVRCQPPAPSTDAWTPPLDAQRGELLKLVRGPRPSHWPDASSIERELTYNRLQPTRLSWIVLAGAFLLAALGWVRRQRLVDHLALGGLFIGTAIMTWGLAVRWQIAGRIPASNMHESLLFLAWGVGFLALVLFPWMRNRMVLLNASGLSAVTMLLNNLLPIDPFIHPMPPVLAGTPWLAIHVPIIMLSYSILALGVVVAHAQLGVQSLAPRRTAAIESMCRTLYWYLHVGCWLLAAGIITGSIWAASSWGRYWGWDPKEVWSLVALLAYLAILHGRIERIFGSFGVAAFSILAFQTVLMTYLGVNFVLTTGMHSYAMGDSPIAIWMFAVASAELAFLLWAWFTRKRREAATAEAAA